MKPAQIVSYFVLIAVVVIFVFFDPLGIDSFDPSNPEDLQGEALENFRTSYEKDKQDPFALIEDSFQKKEKIIVGTFSAYAPLAGESQFIIDLIPRLTEKGLDIIAMQELRVEDRDAIETFLNSSYFNEAMAKKLIFQWNPLWAYEDTIDILRAVWQAKRTINPDLQLIGLTIPQDFSALTNSDDLGNPEKIRAVLKPGNPEEIIANIIEEELFLKEQTGLVLINRNHSFHRFHEPEHRILMEEIGLEETRQAAKILWDKYPDQFAVVGFHSPWPSNANRSRATRPARAVFDSFMQEEREKNLPLDFPFAIDLNGSQFGTLELRGSNFSTGFTESDGSSGLELRDMMDIYVILSELKDLQVSSIISDFINEENLDEAKNNFPGVKPEEDVTAEDIMNFLNNNRTNLNSVFLGFE